MKPERIILESLSLVHPRMLTETVLLSDLRVQGMQMSLTDLRGHLGRLESKSQVTVVTGEDSTRIKITQDGIARLSE
jgi:hypothetical protein